MEEWVRDQGAGLYNEMNRPWIEIVMKGRRVLAEASEQQRAMFSMASYNLDHFRKFVFETKFLTVFDVSKEEIERAAADEVALMELAVRWLRFALFGESTLILRAGLMGKGGNRTGRIGGRRQSGAADEKPDVVLYLTGKRGQKDGTTEPLH